MAGGAQREVLFSLRVGVREDVQNILSGFGKLHLDEYRRITAESNLQATKRANYEISQHERVMASLSRLHANAAIGPTGKPPTASTPPLAEPREPEDKPDPTAGERSTEGESKAATKAERQKSKLIEEEAKKRVIAQVLGLENDKRFNELSLKDAERVWKNRMKLVADYHEQKRRLEERASRETERLARQQEREARRIGTGVRLGDGNGTAIPARGGDTGDEAGLQRSVDATSKAEQRKTKLIEEEAKKRAIAEALGLQDDRRFGQLSVKEAERVWTNRQKLVADFYASKRRLEEQAAKEASRLAKEQEAEATKAARLAQKQKENSLREAMVADKMAAREYSDRLSSLKQANEKVTESLVSSIEGVAKLSRGFAMMGLVGEKETQVILDGLLKVQAVFDTITGSVQLARGGAKGLEGLLDAKDASRALANMKAGKPPIASAPVVEAAQAATPAAAIAATPAVKATLVGAGAASTATTGASVAGSAGAVTAAGNAVAGGGAAAVPFVGGAGAVMGAFVAMLAGATAGVTAFYQAIQSAREYGVQGGATVGSFTDKIATAEVKVASWVERTTGAFHGLDVVMGALTSSSGQVPGAMAGITAAIKQYTQTTKDAEAADKRRAGIQEARARREEQASLRLEGQRQLRTMEDQRREAMQPFRDAAFRPNRRAAQQVEKLDQMRADANVAVNAPEIKFDTTGFAQQFREVVAGLDRARRDASVRAVPEELQAKQFSAAEDHRAAKTELLEALRLQKELAASSKATDAERKDADEQVVAARQRVVKLATEQFSVEQQISREKKQAADLAIKGIQDEIRARQQSMFAEQERLQGSKEQFGSLDPAERLQLIQIKRKADVAGEAGLTAEDRQFSKSIDSEAVLSGEKQVSFSDRLRVQEIEAKRQRAAAMSLNRDEREMLARVQDTESQGIVRQGRTAEADAFGFDQTFGKQERRRVKEEAESIKKLELELKDKRDLSVTIKRDDEDLARRVANDVLVQLDRRDEQLRRTIMEEVGRRQENANRAVKEQIGSRAAVMGRP